MSEAEAEAVQLLGGGRVRVAASAAGEGRGLYASTALRAGELVFAELAFVSALDGAFGAWECHCHACLSREPEGGPDFTQCSGCRWARWCSAACRDADAQHTAEECAAMRALQYRRLDASPRALLCARLFRALAQEQPGGDRGAQALLAATLVGDACDAFGSTLRSELEEEAVAAAALGGGGAPGALLARLARNEFRLRDQRGAELGTALFPLAARLNHACGGAASLCACRDEDGGWTLRLEALRDVAAGEELLFCYAQRAGAERAERRRLLSEQYCFTCACAACEAEQPEG